MDPAILAGLAICLLVSIFFSITDSALTHFSRSGLDDLADTDDERERLLAGEGMGLANWRVDFFDGTASRRSTPSAATSASRPTT